MRSLLAAFFWACAPPPIADTGEMACGPRTLEPGEVQAKEVDCSDEIPEGGEGRNSDYLLQNNRLTAIIRAPAEGLTLLGSPGGTLVDLAPVGEIDPLREAIPVIGGGWMTPDSVAFGVDDEGAWLTLEGPGVSVSELDGGTDARVSLTWRLRPDADRIEAVGAESIYVHLNDGVERVGSGLASGGLRALGEGEVVQDLGGSMILEGDVLILGPADAAYTSRWPDGVAASGTCDGDAVEVVVGSEGIARLEPTFDTRVPAESLLHCVGEGYADGPGTSPAEGLALSPGEEGGILLSVVDDAGAFLRAVVTIDGRSLVTAAEEVQIPTGPGSFDVQISSGPTYTSWTGDLSASSSRQEIVLTRQVDDDDWALLDLARESSPSRYSRLTPDDDLALAAAHGIDFAVQAPPDEVGTPFVTSETSGLLRYQAGSRTEAPGMGVILSWPWSADKNRSGHGAIQWDGLTAEELLAQAAQDNRRTAVDADWLAVAGAPHTWFPPPDLIWLRSLDALPAYVEILESGYRPGLIGPLTWTPADTTSLPSVAAAERGLLTSASVATTGPLLEITQLASSPRPGQDFRRIQVRLQVNDTADLERVTIWADGAEVRVWDELPEGGGLILEETVEVWAERWILVSAAGEMHWAATAPIWLEAIGL